MKITIEIPLTDPKAIKLFRGAVSNLLNKINTNGYVTKEYMDMDVKLGNIERELAKANNLFYFGCGYD